MNLVSTRFGTVLVVASTAAALVAVAGPASAHVTVEAANAQSATRVGRGAADPRLVL